MKIGVIAGVVTFTAELGTQVSVQVTSSLHAGPRATATFRENAEAIVLQGSLRQLRSLFLEAAECATKLDAHMNPDRPRESLRVVNHADGTLEITARVRAPSPRIEEFSVEGAEAVKRYQKWITLAAAGMLYEGFPEVLEAAQRFVEALGPDSDDS
jgi:hypothetical protein